MGFSKIMKRRPNANQWERGKKWSGIVGSGVPLILPGPSGAVEIEDTLGQKRPHVLSLPDLGISTPRMLDYRKPICPHTVVSFLSQP